jgi:hypothetical protein
MGLFLWCGPVPLYLRSGVLKAAPYDYMVANAFQVRYPVLLRW